ncbi:OLC1v1006200C1 [Oldenlandia corymbosa var. corymbosa]|uniref:OLC1v1006200C1 n=1 Tax=Oldenlandia corymbosa var. corymbosa TaxID=529605 RepID=A0AAV1DGE8_OLDCO|nr:OLC1v1006200C1 [Oldenlandia corymbosa var. corymbosa]
MDTDDDFYPGFERGLTTLGFIINKKGINNQGVILALNHAKPTPEGPENYVHIHPYLLASFSGGCQRSHDYLKNDLPLKCRDYFLKHGKKLLLLEHPSGYPSICPKIMTVKTVTHLEYCWLGGMKQGRGLPCIK